MRTIRGVAAMTLACSATGALAADWREASLDDRSVAYVDAESLRRDGDRIDFLVAIVFFRAEGGTQRLHARYEGNCAEMTARPIRLAAVLPGGGEEEIRYDTDTRRPEPGTNLHTVLASACAARWPGPTVTDLEAHAGAAARRTSPKQ